VGALEANAAIIVVVIATLAIIALIVLAARKKGKPEAAETAASTRPADAPARIPASKEVFEPLPEPKPMDAVKAAEKRVEPEDEDEEEAGGGGEGTPWELLDEEDAAAMRARSEALDRARAEAEAKAKVEAEARKKAEEKAKEAEAAARTAAAKVREAEQRAKEAEAARKAAGAADDAELLARAKQAELEAKARKAEADKAGEEAKAAADQKKKAEQEAHAEAARAAQARDKALKEAAERAKAEAKAAAEAEAKAKAEAKRKEHEAKAKAEAEAKAKAEAEEAKKKGKAKPAVEVEEEGPGHTLKEGLGRTRKEGFIAKLSSLFAGKQIDQDLLDEVEEALFTSDIGVRTADRLLQAVRDALSKKELKDADKVWEVMRGEALKILEGATAGGKVGTPKPGEPFVTMVLGVNGTGKTTSIGKMAHKLLHEGRKVTLVAGDTFRAAAAEQLEHWARRVGAPCIKGKEGADPASVVFDGVKQALEDKAEFVLVDTAGRLHSNVNLMEELKKVRRVMGRAIEGAPHEVLMVLDATTGQNGIAQAKTFKDATDVTGIVLTKLDGTAKGGVVLGVCDELKIPIRWIGVGERVADLRVFDPKEFVDELFTPPS